MIPSRDHVDAEGFTLEDTEEPGDTQQIPAFPSTEVGLQHLLVSREDSEDGPRMPKLPVAARLAADTEVPPGSPGAIPSLGMFSSAMFSLPDGQSKMPTMSPRSLLEQIAFDIQDVSKCYAVQVEDTPQIEEASDLGVILESPRNLCGGGCLASRPSGVSVGLENGDINPYDAEWLKAKREEDEEYVLYLKSQSPDGVPLVKL